MKSIERKMLAAVNACTNWKESNTETRTTNGGKNVFVFLFGNCIYAKIDGKVYFNDCGWRTVTTASRLRALGCDYSVSEKANNVGMTPGLYYMYVGCLFNV